MATFGGFSVSKNCQFEEGGHYMESGQNIKMIKWVHITEVIPKNTNQINWLSTYQRPIEHNKITADSSYLVSYVQPQAADV